MDLAPLYAAVYADPDADGPREALAAALTSLGDPRGELISIQLARSDPERAHALLAEHGERWLGALAGLVEDVELARGFVEGATLTGKVYPPAVDKLRAIDEWATLRELMVRAWPDPHVIAVLGKATHLRRVFGARPRQLEALAALEWLDTLRIGLVHDIDLPHLARAELPRLRYLVLDTTGARLNSVDPRVCHAPSELAPLWGPSAITHRIHRCDILTSRGLRPWLGELAGDLVPPTVRVVEVHDGWALQRPRPGTLVISHEGEGAADLTKLEPHCPADALGWVRTLEVEATRTLTASEEAWLDRTFAGAQIDLGGISR